MKHGIPAVLVAAAMAWTAAAVASISAEEPVAMREVVMKSALGGTAETLHLTILQVFFPGMSERVGCRMQVVVRNEGHSRVSMRALINTFDDAKASLDSWLVPTGELKPGEEVLRIYSCRTAHDAVVSEASPYGWPQVCIVDGHETAPCPLTLHVSYGIALPHKTSEGGKEGH